MRTEDLILVSVDDHVVEPPNVFTDRLAAKYVDRAPRLITKDDGSNRWVFNGEEVANVALNAVAGRPEEELGIEPTSFDDIRKGTWDVDERVKDMDANGVLGSMCFPTFPQFCGQLFRAVTTRTSRSRWCRHTTIGTSRNGAARTQSVSFRS